MLTADMFKISLSAVGKRVSEDGRTRESVEAISAAMGDMFCAYLERPAA
jgi:hypothetical protein